MLYCAALTWLCCPAPLNPSRLTSACCVAEDIVPRLLAPPEGVPTDAAMRLQRAAAGLAVESSQSLLPAMPLVSLPWQRSGAKRRRAAAGDSVSSPAETASSAGNRKRLRPASDQAADADALQAASSPYASRPGSQLAVESPVSTDLESEDSSIPPPAGSKRGASSWQLRAPSFRSLQGQAGARCPSKRQVCASHSNFGNVRLRWCCCASALVICRMH